MYVGDSIHWHHPNDCGRCGQSEGLHHWNAWRGELGAMGQAAWEANPRRHEYEAPSDQMRKERLEARIIMEKLTGRHHKVDR